MSLVFRQRKPVSSLDEQSTMTTTTRRSILRWIHIVLAIPIAGYVYSPFEVIPQYAAPTRYVFLPLLVLTGLWMWKGEAMKRMFKKSAADDAGIRR